MNCAIIIPARFASSRFPGKPLTLIRGKSLIRRVWEIAQSIKGVSDVVIATDDSRISEAVKSFGARVAMTSEQCRNGTERVFEASKSLAKQPDVIINMQGDAVLTPPSVLQPLVDHMKSEKNIATPAVRLTWDQLNKFKEKGVGSGSGTFVTCDLKGQALYFSRYPIPFTRSDSSALKAAQPLVKKHIGIYAFTHSALKHYMELSPTPLEQSEQLEQLRALEHGLPIYVVEVDCKGRTLWSIDTPQDVAVAEAIIDREGEVL